MSAMSSSTASSQKYAGTLLRVGLSPRSTNWHEFCAAFQDHAATAGFPLFITKVTNPSYVSAREDGTFVKPKQPKDNLPQEVVDMMSAQAKLDRAIARHDEHAKILSKHTDDMRKFYSFIKTAVDQPTEMLLTSLVEGYRKLDVDRDPVALWAELKKFATVGFDESKPARHMRAKNELAMCTQAADENPTVFLSRYTRCVQALELAGGRADPEETQALEYLQKLSDVRLRHFKHEMLNKIRNLEEVPKTTQQMAVRAQQHDKPPQAGTAGVNWASSAPTGPVHVPESSAPARQKGNVEDKCMGGCGQLKSNHQLENCRTLQQILKMPEVKKLTDDRRAAMENRGARKERPRPDKRPTTMPVTASGDHEGTSGYIAESSLNQMYLSFSATMSDPVSAMTTNALEFANQHGKNKTGVKYLDSGAEISITGNGCHVDKLRKLDKPIEARGISGLMKIEQVGECTTTKSPMYFHPDVPLTIISFNSFDRRYDFGGTTSIIGSEGNSVIATMEWKPCSDNNDGAHPAYFERVASNKALFALKDRPKDVALTEREQNALCRVVEKLEKARNMVRALGYPGELAVKTLLKRIIDKGDEKDIPISVDDIKQSYDLYGRREEDAGRARAEKTKVTLPADRDLIPLEKRKVYLYMDVFFVGGIPFLITVASIICFVIITVLAKQDTATIHSTLMEKHVAPYAARGVEVTTICSDSATAFIALEQKLAMPASGGKGIEMTFAAPNQHQVNSERSIQWAKTYARSITTGVQIKHAYKTPRSLYPHLMFAVANNMNSLPLYNETDATPPNEALNGEAYKFEYATHAFGDPVSCKVPLDETEKRTLTSREEFGILITHAAHDQGWWVFLPESKKVVNRMHVTSTVMTSAQVEEMNQMAKQDDEKAKNKKGYFPLDDWKTRDGEAVRDPVDVFIEQPPATDAVIAPKPSTPLRVESENVVDSESGSASRGVNGDVPDAEAASTSRGATDAMSQATDAQAEHRPPSVEPGEMTPSTVAVPPPFLRVNTRSNTRAAAEKSREQAKLVARIEKKVATIAPGETDRAEAVLAKLVNNYLDHELNKSAVHDSVSKLIAFAESSGAIVDTEDGIVMRLTVKKSQQEFGDTSTEASLIAEMSSILDKELFEPQFKHLLTKEQRTKVIRSSIFLKAKYNAVGEFIKLKARLVANGSQQDPKSYGDMDSPTVTMEGLFMMTAISAHERRHNCTIDIVAAYLEADAMDGSEIYLELEALPSRILVKLKPEYAKYLDIHGKFTGRLKKALYGLIESAHQFWKKLCTSLKSIGFVSNDKDECVMNKTVGAHQVSIACFSDDMYMTCASLPTLKATIEEIRKEFPNIVVHHGPVLDYLGMSLDFSKRGECQVSMPAYMSHVIESCPAAIRPTIKISEKTVPADSDLFQIDENSALLDEKRKVEFHSVVMQIFYTAKRHRCDCLLAISFLTKRVQAPTEQDWSKLKHLLQYLSDTKDLVLILRPSLGLKIIAFVDASYGVHMDMKSQSGLVITVGGAPICCKARTQQLNTKSSTEAEIVALGDAGSMIIWARDFLISQGHESAEEPSIVFEDNMSTIALIKKGKATQPQTRHIKIRFFFLSDYIKRKEVELVYKETKMMIADMFTKPLPFHEFNRMRTMLMNSSI